MAADFAPLSGIDRRKARIAFRREVDFGEAETRRAADRLGVDLPAAGDEISSVPAARAAASASASASSTSPATDTPCAVNARSRVTTTIVRPTAGRRSTHRSAPHDERLAHRRRLEMLEIARQAPRQCAARANDTVARHRRDQRNDRAAHTAIGALIAGQGS